MLQSGETKLIKCISLISGPTSRTECDAGPRKPQRQPGRRRSLSPWPDLVILHALESLRWMLLICHCQWSHLLQNCRCLDGLRYGMFWVLRTLIWWSMIALGHITCLLHLHELVTQKLCPIGGVLWSENIVSSHILYCPEFLCALIEILTRVVTKWISLWSLILCTWTKSVQVNLV